jgi:hypothetical protein
MASHANYEECRLLRCYAVWFSQEPHNVTSKTIVFFIVTTVKTSNFTFHANFCSAYDCPFPLNRSEGPIVCPLPYYYYCYYYH